MFLMTCPGHRKYCIDTPFQVGKYLVSPLTRHIGHGRYSASVSIRTGRGSATHDRVLRLVPVFDSPQEAIRFASAQGLDWVGASGTSSTRLSQN